MDARDAKQRVTERQQLDSPLKPLSERQQQILAFIRTELQIRGYAPSVRDIVRHVGDR